MKILFKENYKYFILCLLLSTVFIIPLIGNEMFLGHDMSYHLNRLVGIGDAFRDGQILPKIYPYTNNGFGYAAPLFYADIFLYPFAIIHMLGIPLVISFKLMIGFYNFIGIFLTFIMGKIIFKKDKAIIILLLVYTFNQYRFIDFFIRSALGEVFVITFIPLVVLCFYYTFYENKYMPIFTAITFALILFSHNMSFVLFVLVYLIFIAYKMIIDKNSIASLIKFLLKVAILGFLLTAWYTLPMLEQMYDQTFMINYVSETMNISLNSIKLFDLFNITVFMNETGMMYEWISKYCYGILIILLPFIYLIKGNNKYLKLASVLAYLFILISLGYVPNFILEIFSTLQFSFRFALIAYFLTLIVIVKVLDKINIKLLYIVLAFVVGNHLFMTYQLMSLEGRLIENNVSAIELFDTSNIESYRSINEIQISGGEYLPVIERGNYLLDTMAVKTIDKEVYQDVIYDYERYFSKISFAYDSSGNEILMLPLSYYKGYTVLVDDEITIPTLNIELYKRVGLEALEGSHTYIIKYTGTLIQHISLVISVVSLLGIVIYLIKKKL